MVNLFEELRGRRMGPRNAFNEAPKPPSLHLTEQQADDLEELAQGPLYGFAWGAEEHLRFGLLASENSRLPGEVFLVMQELLRVRARHAPGRASGELSYEDTCACWNAWRAEWYSRELRPDQRRKSSSQRSSIFNAFVRARFGSTQFAKAVLRVGVHVMPTRRATGEGGVFGGGGAAEHASTLAEANAHRQRCLDDVMRWVRRFCDAWRAHRQDGDAEVARVRSRGLTEQEDVARRDRDAARNRLRTALALERQVELGQSEQQMATRQRRLLACLRDGSLAREAAEASRCHGGAVQAPALRLL